MPDQLKDERDVVHAGYTLLRESCGILASSPLRLISVSGDDRRSWLQGQITNDMRTLNPGGHLWAFMCSPTGQAIGMLRIWELGEKTFIETHRDCVPAVMNRFETMVIMEDVAATFHDDWTLTSVQGPTATQTLRDRVHLPTLDAGWIPAGEGNALALRADHSGLGGWDVWAPPSGDRAIHKLTQGLESIDDLALRVAHIESGIPRWGEDMHERTLPPELGPALTSRTISYNKGCYTGQEVLMRIHSRGHTNKTWVALVCDEPVVTGSVVSHPSREDAGVVTAVGLSPRYGAIATAMLRNEVAQEGEFVRVQSDARTITAEVRAAPLMRFD